VRLSPLNSCNSMRGSDPVALATWLAKALNKPKPSTFYTPGAAGYTDYPTLAG
jgi:hypothetical protein